MLDRFDESPPDPIELAFDLWEKRRTVEAVLSDVIFILENHPNDLVLRKFLFQKVIFRLDHTLYADRKVDREVVNQVAKELRKLPVYFETGTMPDDASL